MWVVEPALFVAGDKKMEHMLLPAMHSNAIRNIPLLACNCAKMLDFVSVIEQTSLFHGASSVIPRPSCERNRWHSNVWGHSMTGVTTSWLFCHCCYMLQVGFILALGFIGGNKAGVICLCVGICNQLNLVLLYWLMALVSVNSGWRRQNLSWRKIMMKDWVLLIFLS